MSRPHDTRVVFLRLLMCSSCDVWSCVRSGERGRLGGRPCQRGLQRSHGGRREEAQEAPRLRAPRLPGGVPRRRRDRVHQAVKRGASEEAVVLTKAHFASSFAPWNGACLDVAMSLKVKGIALTERRDFFSCVCYYTASCSSPTILD